jgi:hypothetical protein
MSIARDHYQTFYRFLDPPTFVVYKVLPPKKISDVLRPPGKITSY